VLKSRGNHVTCFIQTLNLISEQQEAACYRRDFTEGYVIFFNSRVFLQGSTYTSCSTWR